MNKIKAMKNKNRVVLVTITAFVAGFLTSRSYEICENKSLLTTVFILALILFLIIIFFKKRKNNSD